MAPLVQGTDGNFYGTASSGGGKNGYGTVFQITSAGGFTTLHVFTNSGSGKNGTYPAGGLVQGADGQFYGKADQTLRKSFAIAPENVINYFGQGP